MAGERAASGRQGRGLVGGWISLILAAAFVAWVISSNWDELTQAFSLTPTLFILISFSALATIAVNGIELQVLANVFGARVPFHEGVLLGLVAYTLNYLPMKMGTVLNGVLMKARYGIRLTDFAALVWGSSVVHLWAALVMAGVALAFEGASTLTWLALTAGPTLAVVLLFVWGRTRREGKLEDHRYRIVRWLGRAVDGIGVIFGNAKLLALEIAINVSLVALAAWRIGWSFEALSTEVTPAQALVVSSMAIFAGRVSVIPGGLGFKEGGAAAGAAMVGVAASIGLAASVIERAVMLVWLLFFGVPATLYLLRTTGIEWSRLWEMAASRGRGTPVESEPN
jgi:uncharacterized membrane protein YbhN (UPF0104 family)